MNITFDIECIKTQNPAHIADIRADMESKRDEALAAVRAPANYKDADKISVYCDDARAKINAEHEAAVQAAIDATVFDGGRGQVVCIGWAINNQAPQSLHVADLSADQERALLIAFFDAMHDAASDTRGTRPVLIGHNAVSFDIPYIWKRAVIHGIRPPLWWPRNPKPWSDAVQDTMHMWAGDSDRISLDKLCKLLGLTGKGITNGADVWPMAQAGRFEEISDYCRHDVEITRECWRRMVFA
jgi:hypothetical protein